MTLKVVSGLISPNRLDTNKDRSVENQASGNLNRLATSASSLTHSITSDAAITSVKSSSSASGTTKIREYREAKQVAEDIAQEIKGDEGSLEAHNGLSSSSARPHFN